MELTNEMIEHFETRTKYHIDNVKYYANEIAQAFRGKLGEQFYKDLIASAEQHDASKYQTDERLGYIIMSWFYKNKSMKLDDEDQKIVDDAWLHHQLINSQHPEHYKDNINKMPISQLAHMVADWAAVSEELNDNIINWYNKVIPSKYNFDQTICNNILRFCNFIYPFITKRQLTAIVKETDGQFCD